MDMPLIHLYLAVALCTTACKTTTAISTPGCTRHIDILKNDSVARQLESYLRKEIDIIEIHVKTNTCIALTNDDNTISNKTFASASTTEKYNMFIYFIVTNTGRALMKYPADTDTMAFSALGSPKVMMDVDVMLDNHDCALNPEQFRTIFLQTLSTLAPITNNDDISVCYYDYEVSEKCWQLCWELLFLPYYTYNVFKTFCLTGGDVAVVPQALPNKLLRWLCIALHLTLPIGFFFIPHSLHHKTDSYRKCDVPFSVSMFLSYITFWTPACDNCYFCCCNKKWKNNNANGEQSDTQQRGSHEISIQHPRRQNDNVNCEQSDSENCLCTKENFCKLLNELWNCHLLRLFICIAIVFFSVGFGIHRWIRQTNDLENSLLVLSGSSAFYYVYAKCLCFVPILVMVVAFVFFMIIYMCLKYIVLRYEDTTMEVAYPIYLPGVKVYCCRGYTCTCYDASSLTLKTERADLNTTIKLVSEIIFSFTFWWKLFKRTYCCFVIYAPLALIFCIPYVNNCIGSTMEDIKFSLNCKKLKLDAYRIIVGFFISAYHLSKLTATIVIVNITLIQTTTLILQWIVLTLFVGIPVYPKLLPMIILLTGFIKYAMQAFLKFQSKSKYVLDQMFKENRYKNKDDLPKKEFKIVLKQCSSVSILVVVLKIVALMFVWYTAYYAIMQGPKALSAWKDVIPSVLLFIAPDWLSKFMYNEAAEKQYIDQCVKRAMEQLKTRPWTDRQNCCCKHISTHC